MTDMTRRNLLVIAGATACACCLADAQAAPPRRRSHDDDEGGKGPTVKSLNVGKLSDYERPGFYDKFRPQKVMVCKLDDRLVVMSALCTHKGCTVKIDPAHPDQLQCPCHKAEYSDQGTAIKGPAKVSLVRYAVAESADGTIVADLTKSFEERKWEDPTAFVSVKK